MTRDGVTRAACFVTSAYSSWSSCRQYRENLYDAVAPLGAGAPRLDKLRHYFNHPGLVEPVVDAVVEALTDLPDDARADAHLVFVTHSIPLTMSDTSGPDGGAYVAQHLDVAATVAARVAEETGHRHEHALVYCSRSGPPSMPWLEPDVNDHLTQLAADGVPGVVLVPVGFVSDHMEVVYDLDTEALETARELQLPAVRAATPQGRRPVRRHGARAAARARRRRARRAGRPPEPRCARSALGRVPGRLLPERRRRAPGAVRVRRMSEQLLGIAVDAARAAADAGALDAPWAR